MHHLSCVCAPGCRERKLSAELCKQELQDIQARLDARHGVRRESRLMKSIREQEEQSGRG